MFLAPIHIDCAVENLEKLEKMPLMTKKYGNVCIETRKILESLFRKSANNTGIIRVKIRKFGHI